MRYLLKQDPLSWGDDFDVLDATGDKVYAVDGEGFSLMNKLSFQDAAGQELASIRQVLFSWGTQYDLFRGNELAARVSQQTLSKAKCTFIVDVPGPGDLEASGDFYNHSYRFTRRGKVVAEVVPGHEGQELYAVDVSPDEDDVLILASAIVVDLISHEGSNEGSLYK